jgi:transcription antitermination factor NusG
MLMENDALPITAARDALATAQAKWGGEVVQGKLRPLAPSHCDLVQDDEAVCSVEGEWFAIATETREEEHVANGLMSAGVLPYLPIEPKIVAHGRGKTRVVHRPFIVGYVFGKCVLTSVIWHKIMATRGVRRMLSNVNGSPLSIRDREMDTIRMAEAYFAGIEAERQKMQDAEKIAKAGGRSGIVWHFTAGDIVKIKSGPLAGFYAKLIEAVDPLDRIRAIVDLFGGPTVSRFSAHDLEAP